MGSSRARRWTSPLPAPGARSSCRRLTAIAGVAVLSFSSLPLLRDFGQIVAMNVAVALLSALVVLPPMLVWADQSKRGWVSRGLIEKPPEPYIPTPPMGRREPVS